MALRDLLVHIDHYASSAARLAVAVALAKRHQARLTGLLVVRHQNPVEAGVTAAREMFEDKITEAGIEGEWLCIDGTAVETGTNDILARHAQCCDLLVVGQGSQDSANVGVPFDLPESAVLGAGRPVLVVPYAGSFPAAGERILVVWKAGRESVRGDLGSFRAFCFAGGGVRRSWSSRSALSAR